MSIRIKDDNRIPDMLEILRELQRTEIHIGIFGKNDSHLLMIANVNEYGATIRPRNAKRLAIPLNKQARGKSPRSFDDLWPLRTNDGSLYLVRNKGSSRLEFMYWLATEVHIPERAFIRGGFDANVKQFGKMAERLFGTVLTGQNSMAVFWDTLGEYIVGQIRRYMTSLRDPPNSAITAGAKGRSNPLINTGRLRDAITFRVVKK